MMAMIFEFWLAPGVHDEYQAASADVRDRLVDFDGFESVERFESVGEPGKFVAIGFFADEAAVARWRADPVHRRGRRRLLSDYRLRMAEVTRDYGPA